MVRFLLLAVSAAQSGSDVPVEIAVQAFAREIVRWPVDRVACVDVRGYPDPKQLIARIAAPGHTIVMLGECTWTPDGIKNGTTRAFNIDVTDFRRKSEQSARVTVSWYVSASENGHETLLLTLEKGLWHITGSLGREIA